MTDDDIRVTRALTMLADEADPAPLDSRSVIAVARARSRSRRAVTASALVTVASLGALAITIGSVQDGPSLDTGAGPTTTSPTEWTPADSPAEIAARETRLQSEVVGAFGRILPEWDHTEFAFGCDGYTCWAMGDLMDGTSPVSVRFSVMRSERRMFCTTCVTRTMEDGTMAYVERNEVRGTSVYALRPDNTLLRMNAQWTQDRAESPLTDEQYYEFATAITY